MKTWMSHVYSLKLRSIYSDIFQENNLHPSVQSNVNRKCWFAKAAQINFQFREISEWSKRSVENCSIHATFFKNLCIDFDFRCNSLLLFPCLSLETFCLHPVAAQVSLCSSAYAALISYTSACTHTPAGSTWSNKIRMLSLRLWPSVHTGTNWANWVNWCLLERSCSSYLICAVALETPGNKLRISSEMRTRRSQRRT